MLVKVNHTGYCGGIGFTKGEVKDLPENVLKALGPDTYEVQKVEAPAEPKEEKKPEEKKVDQAPVDKQIKSSHNK